MSDDTRVKTGNAAVQEKQKLASSKDRGESHRTEHAKQRKSSTRFLISLIFFFFHAYNTPCKHGPTGTLGEGAKESLRKRYLSCEWMERSW